jgi:hypothetical protein
MFSEGIKKYLMNPSLGLFPLSVYFLLCLTQDIQYSLIFSLLLTAILEMVVRLCTETSRGSLVFFISFLSLALSLAIWLVSRDLIVSNELYIMLPEIFAVCILMVVRISRTYIRQRYETNDEQRLFFDELFNIATLSQYFFTLHIFVSLIYELLCNNQILHNLDSSYLYIWSPAAGIIVLLLYEHLKISSVSHQLKKENWLPIVNEKGEVTGKIAQSVTRQLKNKFLHPVVRVALVCKGRLYLQSRNAEDLLSPGTLDHPFEKYMLFKHDINTAVKNSIIQILGQELPFRFLLKYTFENEATRRLIFLFASVIEDENEIEALNRLQGKFWTPKQIDGDFGDDSSFSECFQLEYEYLKNTILAASVTEAEPVIDVFQQENISSAW